MLFFEFTTLRWMGAPHRTWGGDLAMCFVDNISARNMYIDILVSDC